VESIPELMEIDDRNAGLSEDAPILSKRRVIAWGYRKIVAKEQPGQDTNDLTSRLGSLSTALSIGKLDPKRGK